MSTMNEQWGPSAIPGLLTTEAYHLTRHQMKMVEATEADKADARFRLEASGFDRPSTWTPRPRLDATGPPQHTGEFAPSFWPRMKRLIGLGR